MSLELAAQHLASRGRGPDTQLIHMAPQEVAGLHALAKAHGGELTTNPDTGLPEAGFLSSILPMVIGGALAATGIGAPLAAAMVGGGYGLATGSLSKGLMAGLGAFGGAGLAGGLMGAGAAGAGAAGAGAGAAGASGLGAAPAGGIVDAALAPAASSGTFGVGEGLGKLSSFGGGAGNLGAIAAPVNPYALSAPNLVGQNAAALTGGASQVATTTPMSYADKLSQMGRGFTNLGTEAGREAFMGNAASKGVEATGVGGLGGLAKYGMAAAAPVMFQEPKAAAKPPEEKPYDYTYSAGRRENPEEGYTGAYTGERTYFNPVYTRTAAGGGLMDIQPIEAMSQQNQAQMQPAYARGGVSDMAVSAYTGAENFDEGGDTTAKPAKDPYNTMTGQSAAMYDYLMGQGQRPAAPVQMPVQMSTPPAPAAGAPNIMDRLQQVIRGGQTAEPLQKRYTFNPTTGGFTALAPTEADFDAPAAVPQMDYGSFTGGGYAQGGIASLAEGGQSHLGDYSDGGRLLRGPGDGVSDSIPASIGDKRPARLADGEFVVPARIVSELGNGSTEAGARKLYAMMDRVQKARAKTTGKNRVAADTKAARLLPV